VKPVFGGPHNEPYFFMDMQIWLFLSLGPELKLDCKQELHSPGCFCAGKGG